METSAQSEAMTISLPPTLARFVQERVRSGRYADASAVIEDALGLLRITPRSFEELREMVDVGIRQLDRGEGKEWDVETFLADAHRRHPAGE